MKEIPNGLILIFHEGFAPINERACLKALPNDWHGIPVEKIFLNYGEIIPLDKGHDIDFLHYAIIHRRMFKDNVLPILNEHNTYQIIYFGLAHVPLAIDFGSLFDDERSIEIYNYNRHEGKWFQNIESKENIVDNIIHCSDIPNIDQKGIRTALIRLSVSYEIDPSDTDDILPNSTEVNIRLEKTGLHAIESKTKMEEVGELMEEVFTKLSENRSKLDEIHLFAAIPCGLAFFIGTKISKNNHLYIQTYQYEKTKKPRNKKALLIKKIIKHERMLTSKDKIAVAELKEVAHDVLREEINTFSIKNKKDSRKTKWPHDVIYMENDGLMESKFWSNLPAICKTGISEDVCSKSSENVRECFKRINHTWYIDDSFLVALSNRIPDGEKVKQAFRQLFFSGILHANVHDMGNEKDEGIERFSKVLEMADYQADVYSILNEYGFQDMIKNDTNNAIDFFVQAIEILIETIWSTDAIDYEYNTIPVRKFNRNLIWQWQLIQIKYSNGSIDDIIKILEDKPVIELTGLKTREVNRDYCYELEVRPTNRLELAVFHNNKVIRRGTTGNFRLKNLVDGFANMDTIRVQTELRRFNS